ncbi:MAG: TlpA disulfide reductase family protein [Woeseiaceae bacterium]
MQRYFLIIVMGFVALMAGALFYAAQAPIKALPESDAAKTPTLTVVSHPEFTLPDLQGKQRDFSEFAGRHRLLNFWATWCAPCRREIPLLKTFQDEQGADGILVMGIAVDFTEDVINYAEDAEFNYPILIGQEEAMAIAEMSGIEFIGMPFTMVVSRDGEYLGAYMGELHRSHLDGIAGILAWLDAGKISSDEARDALEIL